MNGFSNLTVLGNLTKDPELQSTRDGTDVCNVTIAINSSRGKGDSRKEEVCFLDCVLWKSTAVAASNYLSKGDPVLFAGRIRHENWEDRQSGQKRSKIVMNVNEMTLVKQREKRAETNEDTAARDAERIADSEVPF